MIFTLAAAVALAGAPQDDALQGRLTALFGASQSPDAPGCAASVWRAGAPVFEHVHGAANLEFPTAIALDTIFEAGSVSKQFAAALIAVLADRGTLSLDDDIRRFVPEMPATASPITIRMLLTHTSGLRNWDDLVELEGYGRGDRVHTQADALRLIARQSASGFPPLTEYLYSNSNYVLAAVIAERASGQSLQALSREVLFEPAGMTRTRWRTDHNGVVIGRAQAYTPDDDGALKLDMPLEDVVGPGGLLTTVVDLQAWDAFLDSPPERSAHWVEALKTTRQRLSDGTTIAYGLGLEHERVAGIEVASHAGATAGYRAYLARIPSRRLSAAVLCNAGAMNTQDLGREIVDVLIGPAPAASPAVAGEAADPVTAALTGSYRNEATRQLVTVAVDPAGARFNGGAAFLQSAPHLLENADRSRRATLEMASDGRVARIALTRIGNSTVNLTRVEPWKPSRQVLAGYEGEFYSPEAMARWRIAFDGDTLRATGPTGQSFLLDPTYEGAFAARDAYWTFDFSETDVSGRTGFRAYKTRTRGVSFDRVTP